MASYSGIGIYTDFTNSARINLVTVSGLWLRLRSSDELAFLSSVPVCWADRRLRITLHDHPSCRLVFAAFTYVARRVVTSACRAMALVSCQRLVLALWVGSELVA